jgi:hypothetical protein
VLFFCLLNSPAPQLSGRKLPEQLQANLSLYTHIPPLAHALRAMPWHLSPFQEKPISHAGDVVVPISVKRPETESRHDSEEAPWWDAAMDALAREIPPVAEPDEGLVVARQAAKPSRNSR